MSALPTSRRRADRFAVLVDGGDDATVEARFEPLLETVGAVRSVAATAPQARPEFVADLRERLMAEAETALVPTEDRLLLTRTSRRPARLVAASAALVIAGGTAGIAVAAEDSLPGQSLYTLKQGLETAGRTLQLDGAGRGRVELAQASTRLDEAQELLRRGDTDPVAGTLQRFTTSAGSGADQLFTAYQADADPADATAVRTFAARAMRQLGSLAQSAPAADRPALLRAADLVSSLDQEAQVLCPGCGTAGPLMTPQQLTSGSAASGTALDLPPAAESAAAEATQAKPPRARATALAQQPTRAAGSASATPSTATPSSGAGGGPVAPVTKAAGSAPTTVKDTVPKAVSTTLQSVTNQATTAVAGVVDAAVGVVGNGVTGLLGGGATPKP